MVNAPFTSCRRRGRKRWVIDHGYTLLEVVCALAMMGLVTLAALSFLGQSFRLWENSAVWGAEERRVRVATRRVEDFIGRLHVGPVPHGEKVGFDGQETSVSGWVEQEDGLGRAGFLWNAVEMSWVYWEEKGGVRTEVELVKEVDAFEISYLNKDQSWVSAWETQQPMPKAIRWQWSYMKKKMPSILLSVPGGRHIPAP